ncbi:MAG TPA: nitronate monooxygenase [Aquabacterium sp.]|uniref:NAD(P)H-dependent flavin oxidoreductase n=1 Tax=Aquabacterium sp. TaxID=1872578 RepID=UPI002E2F503C|nr:nitronate monooxygenase [Aquabacterium sp.]HEX5354596.1 nitronate monooxygenase [Aquabacterium sp.]
MADKLAALRRVGVLYPVMQAGMPGIAGPKLAAAVSRAGGIGTLGIMDASDWGVALALTRRLCEGRPFNANLLLPFTRPRHVDLLISHQVAMATLFWGRDPALIRRLKQAGIYTFQQVGSVEEARMALQDDVDALIVQGREAGGHVRGSSLLKSILAPIVDLAGPVPVLAAGGIYTADDALAARHLGAAGVSTGTRFVATHESQAHDLYKKALVKAEHTVLTNLFGMNWDAPHRVLDNAATRRWCDSQGKAPVWISLLYKLTGLTRRFTPMKSDLVHWQRPYLPLFSAAAMEASMPPHMRDSTALYAGDEVGRIRSIVWAADVVHDLASAFGPVGAHTRDLQDKVA